MEFKIEEHDNHAIVVLTGKIMGGPEDVELRGAIQKLIDQDKVRFVLDFAGVNWINSLGLSLCIYALVTARNHGGEVRLAQVPDQVHKLITNCALDQMLMIDDTVEGAVAALK